MYRQLDVIETFKYIISWLPHTAEECVHPMCVLDTHNHNYVSDEMHVGSGLLRSFMAH